VRTAIRYCVFVFGRLLATCNAVVRVVRGVIDELAAKAEECPRAAILKAAVSAIESGRGSDRSAHRRYAPGLVRRNLAGGAPRSRGGLAFPRRPGLTAGTEVLFLRTRKDKRWKARLS
jgi:hypothetical protein